MKKVGKIGKVEVFESEAVPDNDFYMVGKQLGNVPRYYQKSVFDNIVKKGWPLPSQKFGRHPYSVGVDMAEPGSKDKSVIAVAKRGKNGKIQIWFDEFSDFEMPKWYRHPIKWYRLRRAFRDMKNKVRKAGG